MDSAFISLLFSEIVLINRRMIERFGGHFVGDDNLREAGALRYVLAEISASLFGLELIPDVHEKAARVGYRIIAGHLFHDGNKRTGIEACRQILELNGFNMRIDQEAVDIAFAVARHEISLDGFVAWVRTKSSQMR